MASSDIGSGKPTSHFEKPVPGHQAFGDCVKNQMSRPKVNWIQLELWKIKRTFMSSFAVLCQLQLTVFRNIITSPSVVKFEILNKVNPVILSTHLYLYYSI